MCIAVYPCSFLESSMTKKLCSCFALDRPDFQILRNFLDEGGKPYVVARRT
jgi:hypothetical protein